MTPIATLARLRASVHEQVIGIAVQPVLSTLSRGDHRVPGCAGVRSGVAVWRSIATERPATFLARPQMNPSRAAFHALLAFSGFRTLDCRYCIEM